MKICILGVGNSVPFLTFQGINDFIKGYIKHPQGYKNRVSFHNELGEEINIWKNKKTIFVLQTRERK
jgi:hypothetical protein